MVFLSVLCFGCSNLAIESVPFRDLFKDKPALPAFYLWVNEKPENGGSFKPFLINEKGERSNASSFREKPSKPLTEFGKRLFYPANAGVGNGLDESKELLSPDGKLAAKTYSIKTFADDLNNAYLMLRDVKRGNEKKVRVPAQSNGQMFPLFWHTQKSLLYFMTTVGEGEKHSLELWEYDTVDGLFRNIGDTNGDIFLSPDGKWIVWETGLWMDPNRSKLPIHSVLLCAYSVEKKVNYRLTDGLSACAFHRWK